MTRRTSVARLMALVDEIEADPDYDVDLSIAIREGALELGKADRRTNREARLKKAQREQRVKTPPFSEAMADVGKAASKCLS
jgi:hypothetical protein